MRPGGNTALITDGASGIGLALARVLIENGNSVIVCGRDQARLDAACTVLPGLTAIRADVADAASRRSLADEVTARFPSLNVLVNNAGSLHVSDLTGSSHVQELEAEVLTNLVAPVALTSLLLPVLRSQPAATVVNVTTGYVFLPSARTAPYSATKSALHAITRSLRFQLRSTSVRVVEVMPPAVDTAMASHYAGSKMTSESVAKRIFRGLHRGDDEIVIGISRLARLLARIAPDTGFMLMNRAEERSSRRDLRDGDTGKTASARR